MVLLALAMCPKVFATEFFSDGWESGDETSWTGSDGTSTVETANPRTDTYHLLCNLSSLAANQWASDYLNVTGNTTLYVQAYLNFTNPPDNNEDQFGIAITDDTAGNALVYAGIRNDSGTIKWGVWYRNESSFSYSLNNVFPDDNDYHCLELGFCRDSGGTDGWVKLWVDGVLEVDLTALNHTRTVNYVRLGYSYSDAPDSTDALLGIDDVIISTSYVGVGSSPTIGEFTISDERENINTDLTLEVTIADADDDIKNSTIELSNNIILGWNNATDTFTEIQDTNNYCTLGSCSSTKINATAYTLSYVFSLSYVDQWSIINASVYDDLGNSAFDSSSDLFITDGLNLYFSGSSPVFLTYGPDDGDGEIDFRFYAELAYDGTAVEDADCVLLNPSGSEVVTFDSKSGGPTNARITQSHLTESGTYTLYIKDPLADHNEFDITVCSNNGTINFNKLTVAVNDASGTILPRTVNVSIHSNTYGEFYTGETNSSGYVSICVVNHLFLVDDVIWHDTSIYNGSAAHNVLSPTSLSIDSYVKKLTVDDNYALIALEETTLNTPELWGEADVFIHNQIASGSKTYIVDHANWRRTDEPVYFESGTSSYTQGSGAWSWSDSVFVFEHDFVDVQDINLNWVVGDDSDTSDGGGGGGVPSGTVPSSSDMVYQPNLGEFEPLPTIPDEAFVVPEENERLLDFDEVILGIILIFVGLSVYVVFRNVSQKSTRKKYEEIINIKPKKRN